MTPFKILNNLKYDDLLFLIESSSDGIAILDLKTKKFKFINKAFINLIGLDLESLNNTSDNQILERIHPDDRQKFSNDFYQIASGQVETNESIYRFTSADGTVRWLSDHRSLMRQDGEVVAMMGISRDITHQMEREKFFKDAAMIDALTGLNNRTSLNEFSTNIIAYSEFNNFPVSLIAIDIDHFKVTNDTFGHLTGDLVLVELAKALKDMIHESDSLFRIGGEEFLIFLPKTNIIEASVFAEKLRLKIEKLEIGMIGHITCSFGVTQNDKNETFQQWHKRTDDALYRAKRNGRNCVVADS